MLKLRRGKVISVDPLAVEVDGKERRAWVDVGLAGSCEVGDEVIVNTEALDIGLGSGGFDIVHVNLTRGLDAPGSDGDHVMKLNYSSLQHPVGSIERPVEGEAEVGREANPEDEVSAERNAARRTEGVPIPVLAIGLHGHLSPAAWAFAEAARESEATLKLAYVQTGGGALPGSFSRDIVELRKLDLIIEHVTAGPAYGGESEAITLVGALDAAGPRGWDAVIAGPGPGILGSGTVYGHGGMAALDVLHAALSLGMPAILSPRLSAGDPRPRHQGLSHHTEAILELALGEIEVPLPDGLEDLAFHIAAIDGGQRKITLRPVDTDAYGSSGLPRISMGRDIEDDPIFFAAPLAAGRRLAELTVAPDRP